MTSPPSHIRRTQGSVSISAIGDLYIGKPLSDEADPGFRKVIELYGAADVRFANLEFQLVSSDIPAAAQAAGAWAAGPEELGQALNHLDVTVVSTANNHAGDYGAAGLESTHTALKKIGVAYCGTGADLESARKPAYVDTSGGRIAIISVSSSYMPHARAGHRRAEMQGRAGLSPLRFHTRYRVDAPALKEIARIKQRLATIDGHRERAIAWREKKDGSATISLLDHEFVEGEDFGVESWPASNDVREIVAQIEHAKTQADWVIVSLHTHEYDSSPDEPAGFARTFCLSCIDAGADTILCHGHHGVRGIELHHGKPIFHGLGAFIFQPYLFPRQPSDFFEAYNMPHAELASAYAARREAAGFFKHRCHWESMLVQLHLQPGLDPTFRVYPLSLWNEDAAPDGLPRLATADCGQEILNKIQALSSKLGTELQPSSDNSLSLIPVTAFAPAGSPHPQS